MTNQITFHDTNLNIIDCNGQKWLTASDIAKALGMSRSSAVTELYARHKDEFSGDTTSSLNLREFGLSAKVRVFNRRGAHLIAMFAKTPRAKEFRKWVLDVLEEQQKPPVQQQLALPATTMAERLKLQRCDKYLPDAMRGLGGMYPVFHHLRYLTKTLTQQESDSYHQRLTHGAITEIEMQFRVVERALMHIR